MKEYEDEDQNNNDISDNSYNNKINNNNFSKNSSTNSETDIRRIYEENKRQNKMKIDTSEFLSFSLKVELLFQTLQSYLYWISTVEFVIFLVLFFMYCSSPKNLGKIWWYIFHFFRGIIGLIIIFYLPKTYQIIDNLKEIPDILDKLKSDLIRSFLIYYNLKKRN